MGVRRVLKSLSFVEQIFDLRLRSSVRRHLRR